MHSTKNHVTTWYSCDWLPYFKAFYYKSLLLLATMYAKNQSRFFFQSELHILSKGIYCLLRRRLLQCTAFKGYHVFTRLLQGTDIIANYAFYEKPCYKLVQWWVVSIYWRLLLWAREVCILTTSSMPKTEATNLRLFSKRTAHTRYGKYFSWRTRLLQSSAFRGYHAFNKKTCYNMVLLWMLTMHQRLFTNIYC